MAVREGTKAAAKAAGRVAILASISLALTPMMPTDLAVGDRPELASEARAALFTEALSLEAVQLRHDRPVSRLAPKGARVLKTDTRVRSAFSAGSVLAAASFLRPGIGKGDDYMRTALAGPASLKDRLILSANFQSRGPRLSIADSVMTAALRPTPRPDEAVVQNDGAALAYAPSAGPSVSSRFDDILKDRDPAFVPPLGEKDHAWAATPLAASAFSAKEQKCLATGLYFEARGETEQGQAAVAQVILNRVRAPSYPDTICDVVYQNQSWRNRCQFSFACDGKPDRITNRRAYRTAERIALDVTRGEIWLPEVGSSTHYHATYVKPRWARAMERMDKIGLHIFYRTFGGGWN